MDHNNFPSSNYSSEAPTEVIDFGTAATEQFATPEVPSKNESLTTKLKGKLSHLATKLMGIKEPSRGGEYAYTQTPDSLADLYNGSVESSLAGLARPLSETGSNQAEVDDAQTENFQLNGNIEDAQTEVIDISNAEVVDRLARGVVRPVPTLNRQIRSDNRTNKVTYVANAKNALHTKTSRGDYEKDRHSVSEADALRELATFLENNSSNPNARSMRENLSFIGEQEYKEATTGIAQYWKHELAEKPDLKICALAGLIAKGGYIEADGKPQVKSDDYLLDNILGNFTDADLELYGDRILTDTTDIYPGDDAKVVLLDDWTISGSQLTGVYKNLVENNPQLAGHVEIQLVAASNERIQKGLKCYDPYGGISHIPLRAYYLAHDANQDAAHSSSTHITGFHSSVDFDFEDDISDIVQKNATDYRKMNNQEMIQMPPLTNIIRPYRTEGYALTNKERLAQIKAKRRPRVEKGAF